MRDFGDAVQYSVFACRLAPQDRAELERRLLAVIDQRADQVMLVDLGPATGAAVPQSRVLGRARMPELVGVVVV